MQNAWGRYELHADLYGPVTGSCRHSNEQSSFIKGGGFFFIKFSDYFLLSKGSKVITATFLYHLSLKLILMHNCKKFS
jgi:hypothetical protein